MRVLTCLLMALVPMSTFAQEAWTPLNGAQISEALTDRKLTYAAAWQEFRASGRTLYNAGQDSWGYWRVVGDQYCSQWPPSGLWDCYDMAQNGDKLRFIDAQGHATDGVYAGD